MSGIADGVEHVEHGARRAAVQRAFQRANRRDDRAHEIRAGRRDDARGKRGRVHAVIDDAAEIGVEAGDARGFRIGAREHAEAVGRVRQSGLRRDRRLAGLAPCPRRGEHHDRARQTQPIRSRIACAQVSDGRAQCFHAVGTRAHRQRSMR